jgi:2'-hydroxyisoflavone reductase
MCCRGRSIASLERASDVHGEVATARPVATVTPVAFSLLVLGGTAFLGRHVVDEGRRRGHDVTVLTRGRSGRPPTDVRHIVADRDGPLDVLSGLAFDAVIDTSGYVPRVVRRAAERVRDTGAHYVFVSSASVYDKPVRGGDESDPLIALVDDASEDVTADYGGLKAACESAVLDVLGPSRVTSVRPGLIVGPFDPSGRFTWWVLRAQRAGLMLAPGRPQRRVQVIDARDVAAFLLDAAERRSPGVFDAVGPADPLTMGALLAACCTAAGDVAIPTWVDDGFLLAHGAVPWTELPLWLPEKANGVLERDGRRAMAAGLRHRPLAVTIADTAAWAAGAGPAAVGGAGVSPEKEALLIEGWETWIRG